MRRRLFCSAAMATAAVAGAAHAQTADPSTPGSTSRSGVSEVVVTARKVRERIENVPISMTVIGAGEIRERGAVRLADLQFAIPNFAIIGTDTSIQPGITIRGVNIQQRNIGVESGYGEYIDGVLAGRADAVDQDLLDIERVEVLRGPQGTLFGKNTIAGAINIVTRRPSKEFEAEVVGQAMSRDGFLGQARVSGPLVDGLLYGKLAVSGITQDGFVKNLTVPGADAGDAHRYTIRGGLRFTPSEDLEFNLLADYSKDRRIEVGYTVLTAVPNDFLAPLLAANPAVGPGPYATRVGTPASTHRELGGLSLNGEYRRGGYTFTSVSGYRTVRNDNTSDGDFTKLNITSFIGRQQETQLSQEFRVASPRLGQFDFVTGVYGFYQSAKGSQGTFALGDLQPLGFGPYLPNTYVVRPNGEVQTRSFAVFANANWYITDRLTLNGGLRYTNEDKDLVFNQEVQPPATAAFPVLSNYKDSISSSDVSPTVSLRYAVTPNANVYGTISRGFKSGGFNADFIGNTNIRFGDETATSYEIGAKGLFLDRKLRASLALFDLEYEDLQVTQFVVNVGNFTTNAGSARSRGGEFEFDWNILNGLRLAGGVGYADAKYIDYVLGTTQFGGYRLTQSPEWTANLTAEYTVPVNALSGEAFGRVDFAYRSMTFFSPDNAPNSTTPDYDSVNLRFGLRAKQWEASVFVDNVEDKAQQIAAYSGVFFGRGPGLFTGTGGIYAAPRTIGVRLSYRIGR